MIHPLFYTIFLVIFCFSPVVEYFFQTTDCSYYQKCDSTASQLLDALSYHRGYLMLALSFVFILVAMVWLSLQEDQQVPTNFDPDTILKYGRFCIYGTVLFLFGSIHLYVIVVNPSDHCFRVQIFNSTVYRLPEGCLLVIHQSIHLINYVVTPVLPNIHLFAFLACYWQKYYEQKLLTVVVDNQEIINCIEPARESTKLKHPKESIGCKTVLVILSTFGISLGLTFLPLKLCTSWISFSDGNALPPWWNFCRFITTWMVLASIPKIIVEQYYEKKRLTRESSCRKEQDIAADEANEKQTDIQLNIEHLI